MGTVIAIDGPAASGKSSVARALAARLGFVYVNSGNFYRALTWHFLSSRTNFDDPTDVDSALAASGLSSHIEHGTTMVTVRGADPSAHFHDAEVNANVSRVAALGAVRVFLLERLRSLGNDANIVMEGRDIGSVVFPSTPFKFYLDAPASVRQSRREAQGMIDTVTQRDQADSGRSLAPLCLAEGAQAIDTSEHDVEGVVSKIVSLLSEQGLSGKGIPT